MTRVLPLPAPARMSSGPSVLSTASRCCGFSWSRSDKLLRLRLFCPLRRACLAGAILAQEIPGVDAQFVAIIPLKADGVLAHGLGPQRFGRGLEHWQRPGGWFGRLARFASALAPLLVAQSAGAGVAQPFEAVAGAVAVLPLDVHARSRGQVYLDRLGISLLIEGHILSIAQRIRSGCGLVHSRGQGRKEALSEPSY